MLGRKHFKLLEKKEKEDNDILPSNHLGNKTIIHNDLKQKNMRDLFLEFGVS